MVLHEVTDVPEFQAVIHEHYKVIIYCCTAWNPRCETVEPKVLALSDEFPDVYFIRLDIDAVPAVAQELGVAMSPALVTFKGGNKIDQLVGSDSSTMNATLKRFATW